MNQKILVQIKDVYGKETIYPICETAKRLASLAGTKTFTKNALRVITELGYVIDVKPQTLGA